METIGRKIKDNISYYRHEVLSHRNVKFVYLREKYGWAGEGKFWALNNLIADHDGCKLPVGKRFQISGYAKELEMSEDEFNEYLNFLIDDCNLVIKEGDCIYTNDVQDVYKNVKSRSKVNQTYYKNKKGEKTTEQEIDPEPQVVISFDNNIKISESNLKDVLNPKKEQLVKSIMKYFGFNELAHFNQFREINQFLFILDNANRLDHFETQFDFYKKQREASKIGKHNLKNYLGSIENKFEDGAWNAENWKDKYNEVLNKSKKIDNTQIPQKGLIIKEAI
jgi:hypothetical protein